MKNIRYLLCFLLMFFLFGLKADAAASLTTSATNVTVGSSFTATVSVTGAAAWNVHVNASGPVSGCSINQADASADANNTSKTFTASCSATGAGTITLTLSGDTTDQNGNTSYLSGTRYVYVSNPTPVTPSQPSTPSNPAVPSNPVTADTRSTNNNLKSLKAEGYELSKTGDTTYTLSVKNSIDKIVLKAEVADSKAKVSGDGSHALKVGENKINVVVTAENGSTKTYTVTVTRRDNQFTLEKLKEAISDTDGNVVELTIDKKTELTSDDLSLIKKSNKTFHITKLDSEKKVFYTWTINGGDVNPSDTVDLAIIFDCDDLSSLRKSVHHAEGIYFQVTGKGLPSGTKVKLYVGDRYFDGDKFHLYQYINGEKTKLLKDSITVDDGYITFDVGDVGEYFLTLASLNEKEEVTGTSNNIYKPICIVEGVLLLIFLILLLRKGKKKKEDKVDAKPVVEEPIMMNSVPVTEPVMTTTPETSPSSTPEMLDIK